MAAIAIVPYRPELAEAFASLNRAWIEQFFRMEESDLRMLHAPEEQIIGPGGQIFFAVADGRAVGTVAAVRKSPAMYELAKMAVSPTHQGRGLGGQLARAAIGFAREQGATVVFLETSSRLPAAIRLYERVGFVHAAPPRPSPYERSDVYMEQRLDSQA